MVVSCICLMKVYVTYKKVFHFNNILFQKLLPLFLFPLFEGNFQSTSFWPYSNINLKTFKSKFLWITMLLRSFFLLCLVSAGNLIIVLYFKNMVIRLFSVSGTTKLQGQWKICRAISFRVSGCFWSAWLPGMYSCHHM